jgi:hypothetical protein
MFNGPKLTGSSKKSHANVRRLMSKALIQYHIVSNMLILNYIPQTHR